MVPIHARYPLEYLYFVAFVSPLHLHDVVQGCATFALEEVEHHSLLRGRARGGRGHDSGRGIEQLEDPLRGGHRRLQEIVFIAQRADRVEELRRYPPVEAGLRLGHRS